MPTTARKALSRALVSLAALGALTAIASSASAQDVTFTLNNQIADDEEPNTVINLESCRDDFDQKLEFTVGFIDEINDELVVAPTFAGNYQFVVKIEKSTDGQEEPVGEACDETSFNEDGSNDRCEIIEDEQTISQGTIVNDGTNGRYNFVVETTLNQLFPFLTDDKDTCDGRSTSAELIIVTEFNSKAPDDTELETRSFTHTIDLLTTRPSAPSVTGFAIEGGESNFGISFSGSGTFNLYIAPEGTLSAITTPSELEGKQFERELNVSNGDKRTSSLIEVGTVYDAALVAVDDNGNESPFGEVVTFEGVRTLDFFEEYRAAGGSETGGFCATSPHRQMPASGWLLVLGMLVGAALLRRKPRVMAALLAMGATSAIIATPSTAHAQDDDREMTSGVFELRMGLFRPDIDDEFSAGQGPYSQVFDNDLIFLTEIEVDRQIWHGFGTLGIGITVGLGEASGFARIDGTESESADKTELNIVTTRLSAIYRFDVLPLEFDLPFVPVVKGGLDYYIWWITSGQGKIATDSDLNEAIGGTWGYHVSFGMHLLLDWFDEVSADTLKADFGLVNTYLFAEYMFSQVDDFGGDSINLSDADDNFMFGFAFEY